MEDNSIVRPPDRLDDPNERQRLQQLAEGGSLNALLELGHFAMRRGALVEAYYWMDRAVSRGSSYARRVRREICAAWRAAGCPAERENVYLGFDERQGEIARMRLCVACDINKEASLKALADLMA